MIWAIIHLVSVLILGFCAIYSNIKWRKAEKGDILMTKYAEGYFETIQKFKRILRQDKCNACLRVFDNEVLVSSIMNASTINNYPVIIKTFKFGNDEEKAAAIAEANSLVKILND